MRTFFVIHKILIEPLVGQRPLIACQLKAATVNCLLDKKREEKKCLKRKKNYATVEHDEMRTHLRFKLEFCWRKIKRGDNSKQRWWKILFMIAFCNTRKNLLLICFQFDEI